MKVVYHVKDKKLIKNTLKEALEHPGLLIFIPK
jgi:hypothetical protein